MKKITLGFCSLLLFAISCKKNDDGSVAVTKENLAGSYKIASITAKFSGLPETDVTDDFLDPCEKDDVSTLKTDGTYVKVDAGVQCNPPADDQGTWSLSGTNTFILDGESFTISKFDGKTLQITGTEDYNGQTTTIKFTMNKQ
jgi:hypothetical protein